MRTTAEGADIQGAAVRKSAAQVVEIVAHHPATVVEDRPSASVDPLWHGDTDRRMYVNGPRNDGRWGCGR